MLVEVAKHDQIKFNIQNILYHDQSFDVCARKSASSGASFAAPMKKISIQEHYCTKEVAE